MPKPDLRKWQHVALERWEEAKFRGIVGVVTGGGKTIFALGCIDRLKFSTTLVVVPTLALLDQWWVESASFFDLSLDDINVIEGRGKVKTGTINLAVINTAAKLHAAGRSKQCFLIVDECHKAAAPQLRSVLEIERIASLGLSATPERQYDSGLEDILVPGLGDIIYTYDYKDALRDGVIVPFRLHNIVFDLEEDVATEYKKLTGKLAQAVKKFGIDAQETLSLLLRRARCVNLSLTRIRLALRLVRENRGKKILVFHEDVEACDLIFSVLRDNYIKAGVYHSNLPTRDRVDTLKQFRSGEIDVLVTCRALDEGLNVPEVEIGIIAASTATRRQRIQRLGRVLRPSPGKASAEIFTLVATDAEVSRLREEELDLGDVTEVIWSHA